MNDLNSFELQNSYYLLLTGALFFPHLSFQLSITDYADERTSNLLRNKNEK